MCRLPTNLGGNLVTCIEHLTIKLAGSYKSLLDLDIGQVLTNSSSVSSLFGCIKMTQCIYVERYCRNFKYNLPARTLQQWKAVVIIKDLRVST